MFLRIQLLLVLAALIAVAPRAVANTLSGGRDGAAHRIGPDAMLWLGPGAEARLLARTKLDLGGGTPVPTHVIALRRGFAEVVASAPGRASAILVRAPHRVACVAASARAYISVAGDAVAVAAAEKEILAALGDDWKPLAAGHLRAFGPADTGEQRPLIGVPAVAPASTIALSGTTRRIQWQSVAGAARYRIAIGAREIETTSTHHDVGGLPPGPHTVAVRAIDRYGIPGTSAAEISLRVVGLEVPKGGRLAATGDRLELHAGQRARLVGADGLELSYGRSDYFVKAPRSVGLPPRGATRVRLRDPATGAQAAFRIEPIVVTATVTLGPTRARWPEDDVTVLVRSSTTLDVKVTVNARPVSIRWRRSGRELRGVVPRPKTAGPWVVRAEVTDARGRLVARDFLEVAPAERAQVMARRPRELGGATH